MTLQGTGDIVQHRKGRTERENERGGGGRGGERGTERGVMKHMSHTKSSFCVFSEVSEV